MHLAASVRSNVRWVYVWLLSSLALYSLASPIDSRQKSLPAVRAKSKPVIDGDISDPVWANAPAVTGFVDVANGTEVSDETIVRVLYDNANIYLSWDCRDSQPDRVTARETVRDNKFQNQSQNGSPDTEDNVEVDLDTFNTRKQGELSRFSVNALGTPSASLAGGRGNKAEWKGDFICAAKRTATGWTAEMQIPWKSLNYPASKNPVEMGINFYRFQVRTNETSYWSNIGLLGLLDREGVWNGVTPPQQLWKPSLSILPYVVGGVGDKEADMHMGLDARYTVTPELTAVGSLEPDFSTVEGAIEGIQFSRTERYVPDLRPFFLEGNNYLSVTTKYNQIGSFFYPIRIPTFDVGLNVYGKLSPDNTLGFLNTYDFDGRNDVVARLTHIFGPNESAGFYFGQRTGPGDNNTVGAVDFHDKWGKFGYEDISAATQGTTAGGGGEVENFYYEDKLLAWFLQYDDLSNNFNDEDGYIPQVGYKGFGGGFAWLNSWQHGFWRKFQIVGVPYYYWHPGGQVFQRGVDIPMQFETRSDWLVTGEYNYNRYDAQTDNTVTVGVLRGETNRFRQYGVTVQLGMLANQPAAYITPTMSFHLLRKLDLGYSGSILNLDGVTQQHILTANYQISPTKAFGGRLVVQTGGTNWFLYYHNSGGKGTETYFLIGDPNATKFVRQVELKFTFAV